MTLTPTGYRKRLIDKEFEKNLRTFGAVHVQGPRNCGKTWSSRNICRSEIQLDTDAVQAVKVDRKIALGGETPHLIDEWQYVPEIWDDVRFELDRSGEKGRFILCGSYSLSKEEGKRKLHSGIGRIGSLEMRTMSLYESGDSDGCVSLRGLFEGDFDAHMTDEIGLKDIIALIERGGWPSIVGTDADPQVYSREYLKRLCEEDIISIDGVNRDGHKMMMLIRSLARNESTLVSGTTLMKDMRETDDERISEGTLQDYIRVLERLHILWYQPSFDPNIRSSLRIGRRPKRHLADPSLQYSALGMTAEKAMGDMNTLGFLFESMCERDLLIYAESNGGSLYHYHDDRDNEVDAVIELPDGRWGMFEIKLGHNRVDEGAENMLRISRMFGERGGKTPSVMCVICGVCRTAYRREDGVFVVPITALRD